MPESIFDLHNTVLADYRAFVRSFLEIADDRARDYVAQALDDENTLWPDFLLQVSPSYAKAETVEVLAARGALAPETARIFRASDGQSFVLYRHQAEALARAAAGQSYVVTSGTGSGKSLTYLIPIIDRMIREPPTIDGAAAIIVYPMNALVNSQENMLRDLKKRFERSTGRAFPVTFAKYTGDTPKEIREEIREHPPRILLTNYVMAELLLVRPYDQKFLTKSALRFLVFDELHTYRGRRGADVAMLIRRLKERAAVPDLIQIGTSATMVASRDAAPAERRAKVADFASRLFGQSLSEANVIEETLEPFTLGGAPEKAALTAALAEPPPETIEEFRQNALARWAERELGIEQEAGGGFRRRVPRDLTVAARDLADTTGLDQARCEAKLRALLIAAGELKRPEGEPAFAYKLHQFLSQGRDLYATLEPIETREFSLDGQLHASGERLFVPVKFCRHCGQDYYHVLALDGRIAPHPPLRAEAEGEQSPGYLMLAPTENDWNESMLPEEWLDTKGRLTRTWRDRVPRSVWVSPDGVSSPEPREGAIKMWWQAEPFALCLACGEFYGTRERDFRKLASLSSEARTSATTVLASSLLRHAKQNAAARDKMLSFTDNRQDASLQAGHFNDFVHVALIRSALLTALRAEGELRFDSVADAVVKASGLEIHDIARESQTAPLSSAAKDVWRSFTEITEYRIYEDLRRGWRVIQPNLEQLGLLRIAYRGLDELPRDDARWRPLSALAAKSPSERATILRVVLDQFRRKLAIDAPVLQEADQRQMFRRSAQFLNDFWGADSEGRELRSAAAFAVSAASSPPMRSVYALSDRSALGRYLRKNLALDRDSYSRFIGTLLDLLVSHGLLARFSARSHQELFQLAAGCLIWRRGDGTPPPPDPLYSHRATGYGGKRSGVNAFFRQFYDSRPTSLVDLEAREHTAQVVTEGARERRERRFRWETNDKAKETELGRRLPYLVCSPTMELGVDIADLDLVHMRNVPPTPANYVQRSGRAGRQGQPGLIFTYCGAFNSHDQWYFRNSGDMVAGEVRPPPLDLANEALVRAHLHALWLSAVHLPLGESIETLIETNDEKLPLRDNAQGQIVLTDALRSELLERGRSIIGDDAAPLRASGWYSDEWMGRVFTEAPASFDHAFDRWRELFRTAKREIGEAQDAQLRARTKDEQNDAGARCAEALRQRNLLLRINVRSEESDFYPYRYLAAEGFLPGYNFPSLPIRAWVPRAGGGEFISRPRFLALREFAPGNTIYHEGTRWQVASFALPPGGLDARRTRHKLCHACGAFTEAGDDVCPSCGTHFDGTTSDIVTTLEMPNVRLKRRDRITCEEEDRLRRGYNIETCFRYAPVGPGSRTREADVALDHAPLLRLLYAPAATLLHVNHGWRGRQVPGFRINLENGEFVSDEEAGRQAPRPGPPRPSHVETVQLSVQETHNLLLVRFTHSEPNEPLEASLEYALQRGLEEVFEIEENELAVGRIGEGEHRAIMFFETSEGGAGALERLIEERGAFAEVAKAALTRCHFDVEGSDVKPDCQAACYECLLSFANQRDALILDRHTIRETLLDLTRSETLPRFGERDWDVHLAWLRTQLDKRSPLEGQFLDAIAERHLRLPDAAQRAIAEADCIADFFYEPNACIFCDGSVHDGEAQRARDATLREKLQTRGYRTVVIRYDQNLATQLSAHADLFGKA